jgi:ectoine hydroxylase-related dioxygenase (phytanoyl-CoA dioxygenase family)
MTSKLAESQSLQDRDFYQREGYLIVEDLLSGPDVERLQQIVLEAEDRDEFLPQDDQREHRHQLTPEYKAVLRNIKDPGRSYPFLSELAERVLAPVAKNLLDVEHVRFFHDRILIKEPESSGGRATPWHQDSPRLPFDRRDFLTVWVAAQAVPLEQGPLSFVPRSHRLGPVGAMFIEREDIEDIRKLLKATDMDFVGKPVASALPAGGASFHAGYMMHRANANTSDKRRRAWAVSFFDADAMYTGVPHADLEGVDIEPFQTFPSDRFPIMS